MTAKEYLSQAKQLDDAVNKLLGDRDYWRDLSRKVSGSNFKEHFNSSRLSEAPFVKCLEKIDKIERDIERRVCELVDMRTEINKAIDALEDFGEQLVLRCRYLDNLTWEVICKIMGVSLRTVHRIHRAALEHFPVP